MDTSGKIIGGNIKSYRQRMGLKQEDLARYLDIQRESVAYYESGARQIPLEKMEKLADLFGVDLYDLFEENETRKNVNVALAFRADDISTEDLVHIAEFRKIVHNYIKLKELSEENAC